MKTCPYCGKEYPDDATICLTDRELLTDNISKSQVSKDETVDASLGKNTPHLTCPNYQWTERDAWKFIGMIVVFEFLMGTVIFALQQSFPSFHRLRSTGFGYFFMEALYFAIYVLTAVYFARTETLATFLEGFGFVRKPSRYVWFGVIMALSLQFFSHFVLIHGWGNGVSHYDVLAFKRTVGFERYFFLLPPLLLAPIFEEVTNRGFLYKAFRGSYSFGSSIALIMAWTAITHWSQYSHSLLAVFELTLLTLIQCYMREKSCSLWDCIICHFAFNAAPWFVTTLR